LSVITIEHLHKDFGRLAVLDDINLEVARGEVFGFLGPNGAGKTTTIRILLGLLEPTSGSALVFGKRLSTEDGLRRRIGVLLEHDALYKRMSAYANLDYCARLYDVEHREERIADLLHFVDLFERKDEPIARYSTGMRRKLAIARALVHEPEILFMDEPTSGLDPEAQTMIRDLISELSADKQITVFLNSHNLYEVQRICTKVAILREGRIKTCDDLQNLRDGGGGVQLEVTVSGADDAQRARELLAGIGIVEAVEIKETGDGQQPWKVHISLNGRGNPQIIKLLAGGGVRIEEAVRVTRSLEDIYLETTETAGEEQ
jgi:ABC-2 type transport system ATP-binding protein